MSLETDICTVINQHSAENGSNTPDFILARYLMSCLRAFDYATVDRTSWYDPAIRVQGKNPDETSS